MGGKAETNFTSDGRNKLYVAFATRNWESNVEGECVEMFREQNFNSIFKKNRE